MEQTDDRLARLRAEIASGSYAPAPDAVAEALVGWIARPEQFEGDPVAGPATRALDATTTALHTAGDADDDRS